MSQEITKDTTQYIANKSFDPTFGVSMVEAVGYDSVNGVMRPVAVDSSGQIKFNPTGILEPRVDTVTSSATPTIHSDTTDFFTITALATNITSMTSGLDGTPINGQKLIIRIKDNGTTRTIAWGASYSSTVVTLPITTVISKTMYIGLIWNEVTSTWDCVACNIET